MQNRIVMTPQAVPAEQNLLLSFAGRVWQVEEAEHPDHPPDLHFSGDAIRTDGSTFAIGFTMSDELYSDLGRPEEMVLRVRHSGQEE